MIATSGFLTALDCTNFVFGRGSAPAPLESLQRSPDSRAGFRGPTSKGEGEGSERGKGKKTGRGMEREGLPPFHKFLDSPPVN